MPGPPPKPASQRRRTNAQPGARTLPADGRRGKAPPLPKKTPAWSKTTKDWWKVIWDSPMAAAWLPADVPALVRLAALVDRASSGEAGATVLGEIRQLEDRFGLSPMARRRLQWEVEQATAPRTKASDSTERPTGDPRERRPLRAIEGGAA